MKNSLCLYLIIILILKISFSLKINQNYNNINNFFSNESNNLNQKDNISNSKPETVIGFDSYTYSDSSNSESISSNKNSDYKNENDDSETDNINYSVQSNYYDTFNNGEVSTNVIIKDDFENESKKSRKDLLEELAELEKQTYKLIMFSDSPKNMSDKINKDDPLPYYDKSNKMKRIETLKDEMQTIRRKLNLTEEINFYLVVNNSTVPEDSKQIAKNFKSSYSIHSFGEDITNSNYRHNNTSINFENQSFNNTIGNNITENAKLRVSNDEKKAENKIINKEERRIVNINKNNNFGVLDLKHSNQHKDEYYEKLLDINKSHLKSLMDQMKINYKIEKGNKITDNKIKANSSKSLETFQLMKNQRTDDEDNPISAFLE